MAVTSMRTIGTDVQLGDADERLFPIGRDVIRIIDTDPEANLIRSTRMDRRVFVTKGMRVVPLTQWTWK